MFLVGNKIWDGAVGSSIFFSHKKITMNKLIFLLLIIPFIGSAQFSGAAYVGGIYKDGSAGPKYNLEASMFKYIGSQRYEFKYGNVGNEAYASVAVGEDVNDNLLFMISADYYLKGVNEYGLPKVFGFSSEVRYRLVTFGDLDAAITARWGFNTSRVFGMIGLKMSLWPEKR